MNFSSFYLNVQILNEGKIQAGTEIYTPPVSDRTMKVQFLQSHLILDGNEIEFFHGGASYSPYFDFIFKVIKLCIYLFVYLFIDFFLGIRYFPCSA